MATATLASGLAGPDYAAAVEPLLQSLRDVSDQLRGGKKTASVSFTNISQLGPEHLNTWKTIVE